MKYTNSHISFYTGRTRTKTDITTYVEVYEYFIYSIKNNPRQYSKDGRLYFLKKCKDSQFKHYTEGLSHKHTTEDGFSMYVWSWT